MAKSFFKKGKNEHAPLHSQVVGIIWVSVILLFIIGLGIFLPHYDGINTEQAADGVADTAVLAQMEDSVYRQRRHYYHNTTSNYNHKQQTRNNTVPYDTVRPIRKQPLVVELNSADTLTLQLLHGIGSVRADRIVRYRERLGGFHSTRQLMEVYGITPELVADLEPHLSIDKSAITQIPINTIPLKQLSKHPYIEYYQARDIVRLRNNGIVFHSAADLRAVPSIADSTIERLLPYISFDTTGGDLH